MANTARHSSIEKTNYPLLTLKSYSFKTNKTPYKSRVIKSYKSIRFVTRMRIESNKCGIIHHLF